MIFFTVTKNYICPRGLRLDFDNFIGGDKLNCSNKSLVNYLPHNHTSICLKN